MMSLMESNVQYAWDPLILKADLAEVSLII